MTLVIIIIILVSLTLLAYSSKRRFGVLGLALCAGLVLSQQLARDTSNVLEANAVPVQPLAYSSAASVLLILLPAFILLIAGPKYQGKRAQLLGSVGFGVFATILLLGPLTADLPTLDTTIKPTLDMIAANKAWLLSIGVTIAVADMFIANRGKVFGKKSSH
jgi:hypothetical protein